MYLASNVEDVALTLCRHAIGSGMQVVPEGAEPASEIEWMHASRPSGWQYTRVASQCNAGTAWAHMHGAHGAYHVYARTYTH